MSETELIELVHKQQKLVGREDVHVILKVPGRQGRRDTCRMFGRRGGPTGTIVGNLGDVMLVDFEGMDILAYFAKQEAPR